MTFTEDDLKEMNEELAEKRRQMRECEDKINNYRFQKKYYSDPEFIELNKEYDYLSWYIRYLTDNIKNATYQYFLPKYLGVALKYKGKRMGEKTLKKFEEELEEKTNCKVYICRNSDYRSGYVSVVYNFAKYANDSVEFEYKDSWNVGGAISKIDNTLLIGNLEDYRPRYLRDYVEDIPKRCEALNKAKEDMNKEYDLFRKKVDEYNKLLPTNKDSAYLEFRVR